MTFVLGLEIPETSRVSVQNFISVFYNLRLYLKKCILLLIVTVVVSSLLMPVTMMVSAQTADGGDAVIVTSGANETAATATGNNMTGAKFMFIQGAQSGSVSEVNATTSTLELSDVSDKTILFSDRPDRIVMSVDTTDFIGNNNCRRSTQCRPGYR
jgi:hypothetical protein